MAKKKNRNVDLFDDVPSDTSEDFASMFEQSMGATTQRLRSGDKLKGKILSIGREESFVSTGTPIDATVRNADLLDANRELKYNVGDEIEIVVLKTSGDEVKATLKGSKSASADFGSLEDAFDMEIPIEGTVTEVVNGGYRVSVQKIRAFCPFSQMDLKPVAEPESMVGRKFEFLITKYEPEQRNAVLSRRNLLQMKKLEAEGQWMESHKVGDVLEGEVTRLESYGAFVEMEGGMDGLVHISEIGFSRLGHASEALTIGQKVQVKILSIVEEESRLKIGLSIKQAGGVQDPWIQVYQDFPVGKIFEGTVDKKATFGLFVSIDSGVNGLLPKSKWRDAEDSGKYENAKRGDKIQLRIDEVKYEERKISLGLPVEGDDDSWREHSGSGLNFSGMGAFASAFAKAKKK